MILDTSFLLDLKDGHSGAFEKAMDLYETDVIQRVAMPSVWELYYGAEYLNSTEEVRRVENLLLMYPVIEIDQETARHGARLLARADRNTGGNSGVDNEDGLIGAVADQVGEPVLTDNVRDFEALGVDVETY